MRDVAQIVAPIISACAVFIALISHHLRRFVGPAKLRVVVDRREPGFQLGERVYSSNLSYPCYYFRLRVKNCGSSAAENVVVFLSELKKKVGENGFVPVPSFLPAKLLWTHDLATERRMIHAGMEAYVELGLIDSPIRPSQHRATIEPAKTYLELRVEGYASEGHLLGPGEYEVTLLVAAEHVSPVMRTLDIKIDGAWNVFPQRMFDHHAIVGPHWGIPFDLP